MDLNNSNIDEDVVEDVEKLSKDRSWTLAKHTIPEKCKAKNTKMLKVRG